MDLSELGLTDVTKTIHRDVYSELSPKRPEMSQKGRVVLVTGGGTGVGYAIARAFVQASADSVIVIGRRADVLDTAKASLEKEAKISGSTTKITARSCDIINYDEVDKLWQDFKDQSITVDVLVANVAKFTEPQPLLDLGFKEVGTQINTNVLAPLKFVELFCAQSNGKQQFIVNVSTAAIHGQFHPIVAARPSYVLSKLSGTLMYQLLAQQYPAERLQIGIFHPGIIYNDAFKAMGLERDDTFDNVDLCGAFAVWLTTKEAAPLHGRFLWAKWDVKELTSGNIRTRLEKDPYFLRTSIVGLKDGLLA